MEALSPRRHPQGKAQYRPRKPWLCSLPALELEPRANVWLPIPDGRTQESRSDGGPYRVRVQLTRRSIISLGDRSYSHAELAQEVHFWAAPKCDFGDLPLLGTRDFGAVESIDDYGGAFEHFT